MASRIDQLQLVCLLPLPSITNEHQLKLSLGAPVPSQLLHQSEIAEESG